MLAYYGQYFVNNGKIAKIHKQSLKFLFMNCVLNFKLFWWCY